MSQPSAVPVIDIGPLVGAPGDRARVAAELDAACRDSGFFYVRGHGVAQDVIDRLVAGARAFFALDHEAKMRIRMALGGRAWRGYFPVGGELTSGRPDLKEGLYLGTELDRDDPRVREGRPLHGPNLFPDDLVPALRPAVLAYIDAVTKVGHALMRGLSLALGLDAEHLGRAWMRDPTVLFRVFHYPPDPSPERENWGVGEHTDYGVLTLLLQDDVGGLEVKSQGRWVAAPPVPGTFVCNIGDMLDRMTGGLYRSTPHRVRNVSGRDRYSFPLFFDPSWDADIRALPIAKGPRADDAHERWDRASVHEFEGTYGEYLLGKVAKVFPELGRDVL